MGAKAIQRDGQVLGRLVVDLEGYLRNAVRSHPLACLFQCQYAQHVAQPRQSTRAEAAAGAQQPARLTAMLRSILLRSMEMLEDRRSRGCDALAGQTVIHELESLQPQRRRAPGNGQPAVIGLDSP